MAEYCRIFKKFWTNKRIKALSEDARNLLVYLFTSPHSNMSGIYVISKMYMASDLQWSLERLTLALGELLGEGLTLGLHEGLPEGLDKGSNKDSEAFVEYDDECQVIFIPSWFEHHPEKWNINQFKKAQAELSELPNTHLLQRFKPLGEGLHEGLTLGLPITEPETEPETETETEKRDIAPGKPDARARKKNPDTEHHRLIEYWMQLHHNRFGEKYDFKGNKDAPIISRLLKRFGFEKCCNLMETFFNSDDEFIREAGYTVGVFSSQVNKLIQRPVLADDPLSKFSERARKNIRASREWLMKNNKDIQNE